MIAFMASRSRSRKLCHRFYVLVLSAYLDLREVGLLDLLRRYGCALVSHGGIQEPFHKGGAETVICGWLHQEGQKARVTDFLFDEADSLEEIEAPRCFPNRLQTPRVHLELLENSNLVF